MIESLKRNGKGIILLLISAFSLSLGQLLWKFANITDINSFLSDGIPGLWRLFLAVLPGFLVYAIGAVVMTIGLGYGELSVLQPINSMSYVFGLILSAIFVTEKYGFTSEPITPVTVIGVIVIIVGVVVLGGSSK